MENIYFHAMISKELVKEGDRAFKSRKFSEAIEYYDKVIEESPDNKVAWNNKGLAITKLKKYEDAIVAYQRAIEIDPNYSLPQKNLEKVEKRLKIDKEEKDEEESSETVEEDERETVEEDEREIMEEDAKETMEEDEREIMEDEEKETVEEDEMETVEEEPGYEVKEEVKQPEKPEEQDEFVRDRKDGKTDQDEEITIQYEPECLLEEDEKEGEEPEEEQIEDKEPEPSMEEQREKFVSNINMGNIALEEGRPEEAIEFYKNALSLNPLSVSTWINIGAANAALTWYDEAISSFDLALNLDPENDTATEYRAITLVLDLARETEKLFLCPGCNSYLTAEIEKTEGYVICPLCGMEGLARMDS